MKKLLVALSMFILLIMMSAIVSCQKSNKPTVVFHTHSYENGKCSTCGEREIHTHNLVNRVCSICGDLVPSEGLEIIHIDGKYYVTGIGTCTDTDIVIPSTYNGGAVTSIGTSAFEYCDSLTSVNIPDSVTSISNQAFLGCTSLTNITVSPTNSAYKSIDGNLYTKDEKTLLQYAIGKKATSFTIPNSVTSIDPEAFKGCTSLTSITIGDSVTSIGDELFSSCTSLTNITVSLTNPAYKSIDGNLYTKDEETLLRYAIGKKATSFTIPDSVTSIGVYAFSDCTNLTSITIGDSVFFIGSNAFFDCTNLTSVTIGDSVTSIDKAAFRSCTSLTSVNIPDSVTSIGEYAFRSCTSLTSVNIPDNVTSIGYAAFSDCTNLTSITIGDCVPSIGEVTFRSCTSLTSVTIGDSVTYIGYAAFSDCTSLTSVTYEGTKEEWEKIQKDNEWAYRSDIETIHCSDGDITL